MSQKNNRRMRFEFLLSGGMGTVLASLLSINFCIAQQQDSSPPTTKETQVVQTAATAQLAINRPVITKAEAYAGRPYGLGRISFRLHGSDELIDRCNAVLLSDRENRTFYPVVTRTAFQEFLSNVAGDRLGGTGPENIHHIWFLFRGDQPLDISLTGSGFVNARVPIQVARPRQYQRFVDQWWKGFTKATQGQIDAGDYPPIIETYLTALIGKKLGLSVPQPRQGTPDPLYQTFELLFNAESLRLETIQNTLLRGIDPAEADQPLPPPIEWTPLTVENLPADIAIEPIAQFVPEECFYLRFGTWQNQIWLKKLMEEYGGDLGRMIQMRGFKYKIQSKFLKQLAVESTEFDELFGGNLIADVAVIGKDTFVNDGAAIGVMLLAKNTRLLETNLRNKRKSFAKENSELGVTLEVINHQGKEIELLSTPDNLHRSFYVVSGDCHLVTTSLSMAKRFLQSADGIGALADSSEFRFARYQLPLERDDTVFLYASSRFLQEMFTPEHQIEMRRRNQVVTEAMMLEIAYLIARNEQADGSSIELLVQQGFLPNNFGFRPDGGWIEPVSDHWVDSIRGRRGYFKPIADMQISAVTPEEAQWYRQRAVFFADSIQSLDPMVLAMKRYEFEKNIERIVIDGAIAPFGADKFGWALGKLGPPIDREIVGHPDNIITLQASLKGDDQNPEVPTHVLFGGILDEFEQSPQLKTGSWMNYLDTFRSTPGYLGTWPNAGYTDWIPGIGRTPDSSGYSYSRMVKLWRLQWEGFSILSFNQQRLENLKPHLKMIPTDRPAQVKIRVGDLVNSRLRNWANAINYQRAWDTSIANVKFLNLLSQQFRLTPEQSRSIAERMLDVDLVCALDGNYQLVPLDSRQLWVSDAWPASFSTTILPESHTAPVLQWFRGLDLELSKTDTQFTIHGFLDIQRQDRSATLPSFELFRGFGNIFGSSGKSKD